MSQQETILDLQRAVIRALPRFTLIAMSLLAVPSFSSPRVNVKSEQSTATPVKAPVEAEKPKCRIQISKDRNYYNYNRERYWLPEDYNFPNDVAAELKTLLAAKGYTLRNVDSANSDSRPSVSDLFDFQLIVELQTNGHNYYEQRSFVDFKVRLVDVRSYNTIFEYKSEDKNITCESFESFKEYFKRYDPGVWNYMQATVGAYYAWNNQCENGESREIFIEHRMHKILKRLITQIPTCDEARAKEPHAN